MLEQDVQLVSGLVHQMQSILPPVSTVWLANIVLLQVQGPILVVTVEMVTGLLQVQVWYVQTTAEQDTIAQLVLEQDVQLENGRVHLLHLLLLLVTIAMQVSTALLQVQVLILVQTVWMESGLQLVETLLAQMIAVWDITVQLVLKQHAQREDGQVRLQQLSQDLVLNVLSANITYHQQQLNQVIHADVVHKINIKILLVKYLVNLVQLLVEL